MLLALIISFSICVLIIACSLPLDCWRCVVMNCRRLDGSLSKKRVRREVSAFGQHLTTISVPAVLSFLFLFCIGTLVFRFVIPADLIDRGVRAFEFDPRAWRENLVSVQAEHTKFLETQGAGEGQIREIQRMLWYGSPAIGSGLLFVSLCIGLVFLRCARGGVTALVTGIRSRRKMYARCDVSRMQRQEPSAAPFGVN